MGKRRATTLDILDVYGRVSRVGDDRQRSTTGQVADCKLRIEEHGSTVGLVLVDEGRSAWNPRVHRPAWDTLMERLEKGASDGVVVFDLARFSRQLTEGERLVEAAERGLIVLDSEGEYDLTSASGKKHFREQLVSAAYESDRLSTRVRRGKRLNVSEGRSNHSTRPFGWSADGLSHREDEAAELRSLAERLLAGETVDALVNDLNRRGVLTSMGKQWTGTGLRQVLTLPRHAGLLVHRGEIVGTLSAVSPILDRDTWERVRALYAARRRGRPNSFKYLCSGEVRCGVCGHVLTGRPRPLLTPYQDGETRREYWCHNTSGGCGRLTVGMRDLDAHVAGLVVRFLADPRHAAAVSAAARAVAEERERIAAEISDIEHTLTELARRLGERKMSLARHDAAAGPLEGQLAALISRREGLGSPSADGPDAASTSRAEWEARWESATVAERRAYIRRALRDRRLVVMPVGKKGPRVFRPERIRLVGPEWTPGLQDR
jgi:DNA invertase Pin-like site-specific DNA recombinase